MDERRLWGIRVIIEATASSAEEAQNAVAKALCPDEDHPGYCPTPWMMSAFRIDELEGDERVAWQELFDDQRRSAAEAGEDQVE